MKKLALVLLSAFVFLFTACDSWMSNDDFYSDIENDVKIANAPQISVYVRYAMTRQGKTDPDGTTTFKVEIPQEVSATTEPEYGFVRWAAFPTSFLATGDNQSRNKDVYFIDDEDYNARLLPYEIQSPIVVFENPTSATTVVTINEERNDIFLVPIVAQRPSVSLTIPAKGSSGVVRNMSVRINFTKPMNPESFKNEDGVFDKISVTQGIQSFTQDGDIEISSEDITDRFEEPIFSTNKKMVTLKFTQEAISEGYSSQSSVNITISKDVKDLYGFTMTDDEKISFTVGSSKDTLAPRITQLTAGRGATDFHRMLGMYKDAGTINSVGAGTKMTLEGATSAPLNNIDASFYDNLIANRITGKVIIRVLAEDIAGSGTGQSQTGIETDVAMIGIRAFHMYNADGTPSTESIPLRSMNYVPQTNLTTSISGAYKNLVDSINAGISDADQKLANDKGCLYEYDVSSLPDGLIRIDIAAVDMVQNSGFADGGELSEEYGNGYASLFIVKDTQAPSAEANSSKVVIDTSHASVHGFYNEDTYRNYIKIKGNAANSANLITDAGNPRLASLHSGLKWIVKPTSDTTWAANISTNDSGWRPVTDDYTNFPLPSNQGNVIFSYALMDDLGNKSSAYTIPPIYFDSVIPIVNNLTLEATEGSTAGIASSNVLNTQTLVIPVSEETSGVMAVEVYVSKKNADNSYGTPYAYPFANSQNLLVTAGGEARAFTVEGNRLTFTTPLVNFDSTITIRGIKISDSTEDDALQGNYRISAKVFDAADNGLETTNEQRCAINIDSVAPVIDSIYIPYIKGTERFNGSGIEYWVDYNRLDNTNSVPRTDVYIKFTEVSSGAKIFDFADSSIHLTDASLIYTVNPDTLAFSDPTAIPSTVNTSANTLTINSSVDAGSRLSSASQLAVKITNVELAQSPALSAISLKIHDTATNNSLTGTNIQSRESVDGPAVSTISAFCYDPSAPSATAPDMADNNTVDTIAGTDCFAAENGYTNSTYVDATFNVTPTISGIYTLTLSGDAEFQNAANATYTTSIQDITDAAHPVTLSFDVSSDKKTAIFKNAAGTAHAVLGSAASTGEKTIKITNLHLTSEDGAKSVTVSAKSFGECSGAASTAGTITLDKTAPAWIDIGLYTTVGNENAGVDSTKVYPHPVDGQKVYGKVLDAANAPNDIYFYSSNSKLAINADLNETNLKANHIYLSNATGQVSEYPTISSIETSGPYSFLGITPGSTSNGDSCQFTVRAADKAGNKSSAKTLHIVQDIAFASASELNELDSYMTLTIPANASIHRNTAVSSNGYSEDALLANDSTTTSTKQQYNYVIKGLASAEDTEYILKIKLGSGVASTDSDKLINGADPANKSAYEARKLRTTSTPIEYFAVSHWYEAGDGFVSRDPSTIGKGDWNAYVAGSSVYTNGDIHSSVDASGNIIIKIPNHKCPPLALWLKDGCGNTSYRLIKPSTNEIPVAWDVDTGIGLSGQTAYSQNYSDSAAASIVLPLNGNSTLTSSEINFYKPGAKITLKGCSDSCFYKDVTAGSGVEDGSETAFTLKSRVIIWRGTGIPDKNAFYDDSSLTNENASGWVYKKTNGASGALTFDMEHSLPYTNTTSQPASNVQDYRIFYIIEDKVGNTDIKPLKYTGNSYSTNDQKWLFDNTAPSPSIDVNGLVNINKVSDNGVYKYYYSNNSSVKYTVVDRESGVNNSGIGSFNFSDRPTTVNVTTLTGSAMYSRQSGNSITISNIKDFAGNTTSLPLAYDSCSTWIRQTSAPTLKTTEDAAGEAQPAAVSAINTSFLGVDADYGLSDNPPANDSTTGGQTLTVKSKAINSSITVKLNVNESTRLLGWIVTTSPLINQKDFYTAEEMSSDVSWDQTYSCYKYTFTKNVLTDLFTPWNTLHPQTYFYPVNRAGLIGKPVKVVFAQNIMPALKDNTQIKYVGYSEVRLDWDKPSLLPSITKVGSGTTAINYLKNGIENGENGETTTHPKIRFTTKNNPTSCKVIYGPGSRGNLTDDDVQAQEFVIDPNDPDAQEYIVDVAGPTYEIPLDTNALKTATSSSSGTALQLRFIGSEEDSILYPLEGPAGNNLWVYDNAAPSLSTSGFKTANYQSNGTDKVAETVEGNSDSTKYIQGATAKITLTMSDTGTGVAHKQWKWKVGNGSWTTWRDISFDNFNASITTSGELTFKAPEEKTQYQFRVVDTALNISTATTAITIQRDEWAPAGTFDYDLKNGTTSRKESFLNSGLDAAYDDNGQMAADQINQDDRVIKYTSTSGNDGYINSIYLDFSNITDKRTADGVVDKTNGIERSGIKQYRIDKNWTKNNAAQSAHYNVANDETSYSIDLSDSTNNEPGIVYTYTVKVIDNIGQETLLKTFRIQDDNQNPKLEVSTVKAKKEDGTDESTAVQYPSDNGTYYLKNDKAFVTFTIDDNTAVYTWKTNSMNDYVGENADMTITKDYPTVTYSFAAPDASTTYYFHAKDKVGNETSVPITIQKDKWAPDGEVSYILGKTTSTSSGSVTLNPASLDNNGVIKYSSVEGQTNFINKIYVDLSNVTDNRTAEGVLDKTNGIERSGIQKFQIIKSDGTNTETEVKIPGHLSSNTYEIDLSGNTADVTYTYTIKAIDNIGLVKDEPLKVITVTADGAKPVVTIPSVKSDETTEAVTYENVTYLKGDNAIITLNVVDTNTTRYEWSYGSGSTEMTTWSAIPEDKLNGNVCTVPAPDDKVYYSFRAIDEVGNIAEPITICIQKDTQGPTGDVTYTTHKVEGTADPSDSNKVTLPAALDNGEVIKYSKIETNSNYLNRIDLNLSSVTDNVGGVAKSGIQKFVIIKSDGTNETTDAKTPAQLSSNHYIIDLSSDVDGATYTYTIKAIDNINQETTLKTISVTGDGTAPNLDWASEHAVQTKSSGSTYDGVALGDPVVYYLKRENAIVNFTKSHNDIVKYEWDQGSGNWVELTAETQNFTVTDSTVSYMFAAPAPAETTNAPTTYSFKATDTVGNTTEKSVTLVKDMTNPYLPTDSSLSYSFKNSSDEEVAEAGNSLVSTSEDGSTITIKYSSNVINKIVLNVSAITDNAGGSGLDKITYNDADVTPVSNAFTFESLTEETSYAIKATDKVGNSDTIKTFVLIPYSGPKVEKEKAPYYSGLHYVPTYPNVAVTTEDNPNKKSGNTWVHQAQWIKAFDKGADDQNYLITAGGTTELKESNDITGKIYGYNSSGEPTDGDTPNTVPKGYSIRQINADTKFRLPVIAASLPSTKLYYAITYNTNGEPTEWTETTVDNTIGSGCINDIPIDLNSVNKRHTVIFVWYKDDFGNICVHNLTYPGESGQNADTNQNWWTTEASKGTDGDLSDLTGETFVYRSNNTYSLLASGAGLNGISSYGTNNSSSNSIRSRIVDFFSNTQNTFKNNAEDTVTTDAAKKLAKETKKAAKKAKKASTKKVSSAAKQPVPEVQMDVATISEQPVEVELPQVSVNEATELVTKEIAKVGKAVSDVTELAAVNEAPAEGKESSNSIAADTTELTEEESPSKATVIVLLLILCSCGGAWFTLSRKKK